MNYGSCRIQLKGLSKVQIAALQDWSEMSTNIYNLSLEAIAKYHAECDRLPLLNEVILQIRSTPQYKATASKCYYTILHTLDVYKSYLSTATYIKRIKPATRKAKGLTQYRPPAKKQGFLPIWLDPHCLKNGVITLPTTNITPELVLTLPEQYKNLRAICLVIRNSFSPVVFEATVSYSIASSKMDGVSNTAIGIDLGVSNFATCAATDGATFILDGKHLKGLLQGYRKYYKKLKPKQGKATTKRFCSLLRKSENRIRDYVNKCAAYIGRYCHENNVKVVCMGWSFQYKGLNLGNNTMLFHYFPYARFRRCLEAQCYKYGIRLLCVDEAFTSKASFLDLDPLPKRITRAPQTFSGKRSYRGQYRSKNGTRINADVNGALNILRKGNVISDEQIALLGSRGIAQPQRINPLKM